MYSLFTYSMVPINRIVFFITVTVLKNTVHLIGTKEYMYRIVASSNTSPFEVHPGIFRLLMKGIFDAYVL